MKVELRMPRLRARRDESFDDDLDTAIVDEDFDTLMESVGSPSRQGPSGSVFAKSPAPRRRLALPWIGSLPYASQSRLLFVAMLALMLVAGVFLWSYGQQGGELNRLSAVSGEINTQAQLLARSADAAFAGRAEAFDELAQRRDALTRQMRMLDERIGPFPLPVELEARLKTIGLTWQAADSALRSLMAHRAPVQSAVSTRESMRAAMPVLRQAAGRIVGLRSEAGASGREVATAADIAIALERLAQQVDDFGESRIQASAGGADPGQLASEIRRQITELDGALARAGVSDVRLRDAQALFGTEFGRLAQSLRALASDGQRLASAREAQRELTRHADRLRVEIDALQSGVQVADVDRRWLLYFAAAFGVLTALTAFGLSRAYLGISNQRAEGAERQRVVAENLEQAAKRTNDQNQAAILRLMNELQEVADGDLTVQATVSEDITGAIADSVNYTVEELRSLVARINSTAELVNEASSKAQMTATSLQAASEQQSREIKDTGESVLRMAQQINEVSARAAESVQVARQSLRASQDGSRAVNNAISGMNGIRGQIQETAKRIKRLGESSQEIGEIVELISDITEQTNVLALNAAIQAASAGEAGRGFTIVAEEVQRLAERSGEATKQIATLIKTIQTDTQDAVAAMEQSTQGVVEGTRLSDEAGSALEEIGRVSSHLAELIEDFSDTTSKQAASAGTVAQSIQRILLVTEQTSEGTLQTAGSIRQLSELAQELKNSVSRFKVS